MYVFFTLNRSFYSSTSSTPSSVASLPIESTPLFYLGWHLNGVGPLPPPAATTTTTRRQGPRIGCPARGKWTATLDYVQKTLHLGAMLLATQDGRNEYARDKRPGLVFPHFCRLLCNAAKEPTQASPTRLVRSALRQHVVLLPASRSAFYKHRSATSQRKSRSVSPLHLFWAACDEFGIIPQGRHTEIETLDNQ